MEKLNPTILESVRDMARKGDSPTQILRELINRLEPGQTHKITLMVYLREAFGLSLQQVSPVGGWAADGSGELSDSRLNYFLAPEIEKNRSKWEALGSVPLLGKQK